MNLCGILPKRKMLDNKAYGAYKNKIQESGMTYQLVPPNEHRQNIAEKEIQTWKDHFIGVLSVTTAIFQMNI